MFDVENLTVRYGKKTALNRVTLQVSPGESVGLIGESGSGKTTLARAAIGLVKPASGRIAVTGEDVTGYPARRWRALRRRGVVQYVFQDPLRSLDPDLPVGESLAEPLRIQGAYRRDAVYEALETVHLGRDLAERLPGEISGGQRQRIAVARALITKPKLIILDEPVSALDAHNRVLILELLKELRDAGTALLFISHDLGSVAGVADRIAVLYRGDLVETGRTREVVNEPVHPYTRLLVSSAPTLGNSASSRAGRAALRREINA